LHQCRKLLHTAFIVVALCAAATARASFIAAIDDFTITRNGLAFFSDPFSDGVPPPSAPNFAGGTPASYSVFGTTPQPETGGKYYMDSTLGGYTLAGDGTARLRNINTLLTNTDPSDTVRGLKPNHTFTVGGLFDLVAPPVARDGYGISLKDTTGPAPGQATAGQVWSIFVGRIGSGALGIHLILQDYTAHTISLIASSPLDFSHEQILLTFDRDDTSNSLAHAGWQYFDSGGPNGEPNFLGNATIFQSQQWVRTDFFTNQETPVIPAPASGLLILAGLGVLAAMRRRAQQRAG
jgi:hypothetical protein